MKTASALLADLRERNVRIWAENDKLRFEAPKGAMTPALLEQVRARKEDLLGLLAQNDATSSQRAPLSFAQRRLWFLHQLDGASSAYNTPFPLRLRGSVDADALRRALAEIVRRHEILRTVLDSENGEPFQKALPFVAPDLSIIDLAGNGEEEREAEIRRRVSECSSQPFDLANGPLFAFALLRAGAQDHVLIAVMHHIATDGWSMGVFARELSALYAAFSAGLPSPLPPLPMQYRDFARRQQAWFEREGGRALDYWLQRLADAPALLTLPTDFPRPAVQSFQGSMCRFRIPRRLSENLRQLARSAGTTLFVLTQTAFAVLLARYSGMDDILVGTPVANRDRLETEGLIGFFVNMLAMRTRMAGDPDFMSLLADAHGHAMDAYEHQSMPFEQLVERLHPARSLNHSPLFQVSFALQNAPDPRYELPGLRVEKLGLDWNASAYDLTLMLKETEEGMEGFWEYDTALFLPETIRRFEKSYSILLQSIVERPRQRVSELPLLDAADRERLLHSCNDTVRDYPLHMTVAQGFEAQAAATPDAPALMFLDRSGRAKTCAYRELDERADRAARRLIEAGAGPERIVGLCFGHEPEAPVAMLATLKAGAAYLALDPEYPDERLAFMLQDATVAAILTCPEWAERIGALAARCAAATGAAVPPLLPMDAWDAAAEPIGRGSDNPPPRARPENLAAVFYTSGTTGKPKGTLLEHRNVANHAHACREAYGLTASDRALQFTSHSFDVTLEEIFPTWLAGGTVVLRPRAVPSIAELTAFVEAHGITVLNLPTGYWHEWALQLDAYPPPACVRLVVAGNDKVLRERLKLWRERVGARVAWRDAYGASEATVTSTLYDPEGASPGTADGVPIGRPIANVRIYLLDERRRPVPYGVAGEAYIAGAGVARGYLNRPELTEARFLPDPFAPGRMYRTGDQFRYLPDGNLEFLGRIDRQVKIRGFRVELGEVEAALAEHPAVLEAVAMARTERSGHLQLVAYAVLSEKTEVASILDFVKAKVPAYMVPAALVALDRLPVTSAGKIDWKALPPPDAASYAQAAFAAPQTGTEDVLAGIWRETLKVERVGRHDDFFDLGGHSLLVTQLLYQIKQIFRVDLPVQSLFQYPTLATFAEAIDHVLQSKIHDRDAPTIDWRQESALDPDIRPAARTAIVPAPQAVLLTGATGFLGTFLLHELLRGTSAKIYCLVRGKDPAEAMERLFEGFRQYRLEWREEFARRVEVLVGNLARPRLGLSEARFAELADTLDAIYHNGAWVNFLYPYETLKAANVGGTREVLRLAAAGRGKSVHYVSTISVCPATDGVCREDENVSPEIFQAHALNRSGYLSGKWVSERLVLQAGERGMPICIYRPGQIVGDSRTGAVTAHDLYTRDIKTCLQLGIYPEFGDAPENLAPVDYVSRAIVHLSRMPESCGKIFHLTNPASNRRNDFIDHALRSGYRLQALPFQVWQARVLEACQGNPRIGLYPLLPLLTQYAAPETFELPRYECANTMRGLEGSGVCCPRIDSAVLDIYFAYLVEIGEFPAPGAVADKADETGANVCNEEAGK